MDFGRSNPPWDHPRSWHGVRVALATAESHGLDAGSCLDGTGVRVENTLVEAGQELAVNRSLIAHLGDRAGLGAETGLRYTLNSMGMLGLAMMSSPTVRDAGHTGLRYLSLASAFVRPSLREEGPHAHIDVEDDAIDADVRDFLAERDIASLATVTVLLLGDGLDDADRIVLHTRLDAERRRCLAELLPRVDVVPADHGHRLSYPRRLLDRPPPGADPYTAALSARECQTLVEQRSDQTVTTAAVRSQLLRDPRSIPSMVEVADHLGITTRTLARRLAAESLSFRTLVEDLRRVRAVQLLTTTTLSVQQIATRLGYAETASFSHAFSRWHATTPGRYRKTHT